MMTIVKINSLSIKKLKSAISSTDINAKKEVIAEVFVLAYGYKKVEKTAFEDCDIDAAIKIIENQGVILQEELKSLFPRIATDKELQERLMNKTIEKLADEILK